MDRAVPRRPYDEDQTVWQAAGWSREPRNGREWKALKAGEPEPEPAPKPCRKCGGREFSFVTKLRKGAPKLYRQCEPCRRGRERRYRAGRPEYKARMRARMSRRYRSLKEQDHPPVDGHPTIVPREWTTARCSTYHSRLIDGETFGVEVFGTVLYYAVPAAEYTRLRQAAEGR